MIVDEAHNAMTGLSREMQARVNPCAIVEFTATPHFNSNILHNVTAQELKREEMIKLPIVLTEHADWQSAVSGAVATRAALAEKALLDTAAYIRPIVLFQAQPRDEDVTVEVLKRHLIETENIPEDKIAVATGDQRELDAIDLFDPKTKIEYVITVEALKEGWDCSFAYIFCSVSKIKSATAVEQLLGRVLRIPYAKRRAHPELNKAYAHIAEPVFTEAAKALVDRLVDMGFDDLKLAKISKIHNSNWTLMVCFRNENGVGSRFLGKSSRQRQKPLKLSNERWARLPQSTRRRMVRLKSRS